MCKSRYSLCKLFISLKLYALINAHITMFDIYIKASVILAKSFIPIRKSIQGDKYMKDYTKNTYFKP